MLTAELCMLCTHVGSRTVIDMQCSVLERTDAKDSAIEVHDAGACQMQEHERLTMSVRGLATSSQCNSGDYCYRRKVPVSSFHRMNHNCVLGLGHAEEQPYNVFTSQNHAHSFVPSK
jgi:hypothetical protein